LVLKPQKGLLYQILIIDKRVERWLNYNCHSFFERFDSEFHRPQPTLMSHSCYIDGKICRVANEANIEDLEMKFMSYHAIFNLFHVCICN
jgi:hypothetical protein